MTPGMVYHLYNHANGMEDIFNEDENYRYFIELYYRHVCLFVDTYAYCLLPNHFHFLLRIKELEEIMSVLKNRRSFFKGNSSKEENFSKVPNFGKVDKVEIAIKIEHKISKAFSNMFSAYTQAFNKRYGRKGSLFMKNFKRKPIDTTEQWQETFLYIHLNAVNHGFVQETAQWPWSSYHLYLKRTKNSIIDLSGVLEYFGSYDNMMYCIQSDR